MMKATVALLCIALLPTVFAANCSISGSWDDPSILGGQKAVFNLEISPGSGFVDIEFRNEFNDLLWSDYHLQIPEEYQIKISTEPDWINGTYYLEIFYDETSNGSDCDKTLASQLEVRTSHNRTASIDITVEQSYTLVDTAQTCIPITSDTSTFDICATGSAAKGLVESLFFDDIQVVPGTNLGNIQLGITTCTADIELQDSIKTLDDKLVQMADERDMLMVENGRLNALICGEGGKLIDNPQGMVCTGGQGTGYIFQINDKEAKLSTCESEKVQLFGFDGVLSSFFLGGLVCSLFWIFLARFLNKGHEVIIEE